MKHVFLAAEFGVSEICFCEAGWFIGHIRKSIVIAGYPAIEKLQFTTLY